MTCSREGFLNLDIIAVLCQIILCWGGGLSCCRMFKSILGLYPLKPGASVWQLKMSLDTAKRSLRGEIFRGWELLLISVTGDQAAQHSLSAHPVLVSVTCAASLPPQIWVLLPAQDILCLPLMASTMSSHKWATPGADAPAHWWLEGGFVDRRICILPLLRERQLLLPLCC